MSSRKDGLRRRLDGLLEEIARLEERPEEPSADPQTGEKPVIRFDLTMGVGSHLYSFAAISCGGVWYVTGGRASSQALSWDELCDFIESNTLVGQVWLVSAYEALS